MEFIITSIQVNSGELDMTVRGMTTDTYQKVKFIVSLILYREVLEYMNTSTPIKLKR